MNTDEHRCGRFAAGRELTMKHMSMKMRIRVVLPVIAALLVIGVLAVGLQQRRASKQGSPVAPPAGAAVAESAHEAAPLRAFASTRRGFLVWSSNRFGNHDILRLSLPDLKLTQLTTHPHVDTFPRISPDGTRVVFCRSQAEWVSQRKPIPWDVIMLDLNSGQETVIARSGNTPTWSEDGQSVYFQRDGGTFVEHRLDSDEEIVLFESGRDPIPGGVELQTPAYDAGLAAMAVTLRGRHRATAVVYRDGRMLRVGGGCQLTWTGIDPPLCYVDGGGRQKNMIYGYDPETRTRVPWFDLPGEFSHEYFPKVSNDGSVLVFGASRGGRNDHEHDTADYEIFAWPLGAPPESAVRVTFHTGNDCWPDLHLHTQEVTGSSPVPPTTFRFCELEIRALDAVESGS